MSPTRLEGMESVTIARTSSLNIRSPTRLEGMESFYYFRNFYGFGIVSDPP